MPKPVGENRVELIRQPRLVMAGLAHIDEEVDMLAEDEEEGRQSRLKIAGWALEK